MEPRRLLAPIDRRALLLRAAWAAMAGSAAHWSWAQAPVRHDPFGLGVASGEPRPDSVVLWTRLLPPTDLQALPGDTPPAWAGALAVRWELADDANFRRIVQRGTAPALLELGHSVHVEVQGLEPGRWYHYRFLLGDAVSPPARTRTAPAPHELPARLRVVHASCQRWEHGHYAAWRHAAAEQPDLVLFLGDYIYEYATPRDTTGLARTHGLPLARTLTDFRDRYALHKSDLQLQAAHACAPWTVTWDDHEVQNDYAGGEGQGSPADFLLLRAAAWQAFYENMPLRASTLAGAGNFHRMALYRRQAWGRLARLHLLDTRQWRDRQACRSAGSAGARPMAAAGCAELSDPGRSLLGREQEGWLHAGLAADAADEGVRWSVLAQQTLLSPRHSASGRQSTDSWDGYPAARGRLLAALAQTPPRNTVVLGGDIHQNYVCNVMAPEGSAGAERILASEFCGTSISSRSSVPQERLDALRARNPHVLLARSQERGYCVSDITPGRWQATLRAVRDPLDASSDAFTLARFVVEDGRPGPQAD